MVETAFSAPRAAFIRQSLLGEDAVLQASFSEVAKRALKDPRLFRPQAFLTGAWVDADGCATVAVTDPAADAQIGLVPALGAEETIRAVNAAEEALPLALPTEQQARSPARGVAPVNARERRRPFPDHDCRDLEPRERWLGNLPRSMLPKWQRSRSTTLRPLIWVCVPTLGAGKYGDMASRWACRLAVADTNLGRPLNMRASKHWSASWRS